VTGWLGSDIVVMKNVDMTNPAEVLALLKEQCDLCRQISSFAQTQRSLITGDEPERLLALMAQRQTVLDRLTQVGQQLKPIQRNWMTFRGELPAAQAREADDLIREVNRLLAGILQMDEADARLLSARKDSTAQQLQQVGRGRMAGAAYAASGASAAPMTRVDWTDE
jgi:hypothetical protein